MDKAKKEHLERQFWCMTWAQHHFAKAKEIAQYFLDNPNPDRKSTLYYACMSSICLTYSKLFIKCDNMGTLPKDFYTGFPNPDLKSVHDTMLEARNAIYAHTDATAHKHKAGLDVRYDKGTKRLRIIFTLSQPTLIALTILPPFIELCDYQIKQTEHKLLEITGKPFPNKTLLTVMTAEQSCSTHIDVVWPEVKANSNHTPKPEHIP